MPLVTVTVQSPKSPEFKRKALDAVHAALVAVGVPEADRFQRVLELPPEDFVFDAHYPDTARPRGPDFVLVELLWSVGRSVKVKRQMLAELVRLWEAAGLDAEQLMLVIKETQWENWSFAGGRLLHT